MKRNNKRYGEQLFRGTLHAFTSPSGLTNFSAFCFIGMNTLISILFPFLAMYAISSCEIAYGKGHFLMACSSYVSLQNSTLHMQPKDGIGLCHIMISRDVEVIILIRFWEIQF